MNEEAMAEVVSIDHRDSCPVKSPHFKIPWKRNGDINTRAKTECNCDFLMRLRDYLSMPL